MTEDLSNQADEARGDAGSRGERKLSLFSLALWGPDGPPEQAESRESLVNDDGEHVSPIRQRVAIPPPNLLLSQGQMQAIALGHRPVWEGEHGAVDVLGDAYEYLIRQFANISRYVDTSEPVEVLSVEAALGAC